MLRKLALAVALIATLILPTTKLSHGEAAAGAASMGAASIGAASTAGIIVGIMADAPSIAAVAPMSDAVIMAGAPSIVEADAIGTGATGDTASVLAGARLPMAVGPGFATEQPLLSHS